jgi:hypothetical protein
MPRTWMDLRALRNLIAEADILISTTGLPEDRSRRAHELLTAALALAEQLLSADPDAVFGAEGTKKTA